MHKSDVIAYFGSQSNIAKALGIKQPSVSAWPELVPKARALEIEKITKGRLACDLSAYHDFSRQPSQ